MIRYALFVEDGPDRWVFVEHLNCAENSYTAALIRTVGYCRVGNILKVPADHPVLLSRPPGVFEISLSGTTLDQVFGPPQATPAAPACECGAAKLGAPPMSPTHSRWCPEFSDAPKAQAPDLVAQVRAHRKGARA